MVRSRRILKWLLPVLAIVLATGLAVQGCSRPLANRNPVGEPFPSVTGRALDGAMYTLPRDVVGEPTLLIVAYKMEAQFDVDRWLMGLAQFETPVRLYEVPTVRGIVPGMISKKIDQGMRNGIPRADWGVVVTVYRDAKPIAAFTGTQNPRNARVLLLDTEGRVVWFNDEGFSARLMKELDNRIRTMKQQAAPPGIMQ